ncbi:MAG: hypothetical protein PHV06_09095 [bacterium]|nr:hypothetical protein [bacterium]
MNKFLRVTVIFLLISFFFSGCSSFNGEKRQKLTLVGISNQMKDSFAVFKDKDDKYIFVINENKEYNFEIKEFHITFLVISSGDNNSGKDDIWKVGESKSFKLRGKNET